MNLLLANSATPVMFQTMALVVFGNVVIGFIEGSLLARVFRLPPGRTILLLILANYCSAVVGAILFGLGEARSYVPHFLFDVPLHHPQAILWLCVAIAFATSVVFEWPFCWLAGRKPGITIRKSLFAALLANIVTYPLLIILFAASINTIGRDVEVAPLQAVLPESINATVYYIAEDGAVYRIGLDGSNREQVVAAQPMERHDVLGWIPIADDEAARCQLTLSREAGEELLFERTDGRCEAFLGFSSERAHHGFWLSYKGIADMRPADVHDWNCEPNGNRGIIITRESTKEKWRITYDNPFVSWTGRCITILPGDIAVFELGNQVCVLSMRSQEIAFLARGRSPAVLLH